MKIVPYLGTLINDWGGGVQIRTKLSENRTVPRTLINVWRGGTNKNETN